jgi:hypothetical protein
MEERFTLAHGFSGFSPSQHGETKQFTGGKRERERERGRERK